MWRDYVRRPGLAGAPQDEGDGLDDIGTLRKKKLLAEIADKEFKNAVARGEYVRADLVRQKWLACITDAISLLRMKFEDELPPILSGLDAVAIRGENQRAIDEVAGLLHEGGSDGGE